ncbi:hypothetical protein Q9L58_004984 [Maublancomyces gigas]|uniref:Uncharacterized protein n=1 Tax=Discina gigas TaxID=1032678 RepID=A0ABR3GJQ7_9PEZI
MSDFGRKDFSSNIKEGIMPDHSKSATRRVKENVTDALDHVAAGVNPDGNKSASQKVFDKSRREKEHHTHTGPLDKAS